MAEYIERQAAIDWLSRIEQVINDIPAADVRPVVRGRWVAKDIGDDEPVFLWACSLCGEEGFYKSSFCPNCGAEMRGDTDG